MATYRFQIRSTGRPFRPSEPLDDSNYQHIISRHTTLNAARKRLSRETAEMRARCDPHHGSLAAWNDHYAIFALRDTLYTMACPTCCRQFQQPWESGHTAPAERDCPDCTSGQTDITTLPLYAQGQSDGAHDKLHNGVNVSSITDPRLPYRQGYHDGYGPTIADYYSYTDDE